MQSNEGTWVAVTGASGFTGGHIVEELLRSGYVVHAVVRGEPTLPRYDFLRQLSKKYEGAAGSTNLKLFSGDLTKPGSFDAPFAGCSAVIHVAAVTELAYRTCPFTEIIDPSVEGCREVGRAATRAHVRRIVVTSSASIVDQLESHRSPHRRGTLFTEDDTRLDLRPDRFPYIVEKYLGEKALCETFLEGDVLSLLPSLIIGPQQNEDVRSSQQLLKLILNAEAPVLPRFYASWIDVRDVATAHRCAVEAPVLPCEHHRFRRYIISGSEVIGMDDIARSIVAQFAGHVPFYRSLPTKSAPYWLLWVSSFFDRRLTHYVLNELGVKRCGMSGLRAEKELHFRPKWTTLDRTVRDAVESFFRFGLVKNLRTLTEAQRLSCTT